MQTAPGLDQIAGLVRIGREMEIGVEDLAFAQHGALDRLRFLDLHDHVGLGEDLGGSRDDHGAGGGIVGVRGADAGARIGLHPDLVALAHGFAHRHGRHADAVFVILDFLRYADEHVSVLPEMVRNIPRNRSNEFSKRSPEQCSIGISFEDMLETSHEIL